MGVAVVLGETVSVLDTSCAMVPLGVRVPVLLVDVEPDTELVEE